MIAAWVRRVCCCGWRDVCERLILMRGLLSASFFYAGLLSACFIGDGWRVLVLLRGDVEVWIFSVGWWAFASSGWVVDCLIELMIRAAQRLNDGDCNLMNWFLRTVYIFLKSIMIAECWVYRIDSEEGATQQGRGRVAHPVLHGLIIALSSLADQQRPAGGL